MENFQLQNISRSAITILGLPLLLILMTSASCNDQSDGAKENIDVLPEISVQELSRRASLDTDFFLLDVRTEPEFVAGRLEFSDMMIPYDSLAQHLDAIPADKDAEIYVFCRSGRRSGIATGYLISQGYSNVYNVAGGIIAWNDAKFEIVSGEVEPTQDDPD